MKDYEAIVAGHLCVDLIPTFPQDLRVPLSDMVQPGKLNHVGPLQISTGGAVANTGVALIKLGARTRLMGKVGNDHLGAAAIGILRRYAPDSEDMVHEGENTSYTIVLSPASIDRVFLHYPGCNGTFTVDDLDESALSHTKIMHFGYPPLMKALYINRGEQLVRLLKTAKKHKVTVSLDLAMPDPGSDALKEDWRLILKRALPLVDIFLPSLEESLLILEPESFKSYQAMGPKEKDQATPDLASRMAKGFLELGASIVGIKCGILGYHVQTSPDLTREGLGKGAPKDLSNWTNRKLWCASYKPETFTSATGAGDCSIAGFLMGLLRGCSLEETVNSACAVGAQNVRMLDATSGVDTWEYTLEMISQGWERLPVPLDEVWTYDPQGKVWVSE